MALVVSYHEASLPVSTVSTYKQAQMLMLSTAIVNKGSLITYSSQWPWTVENGVLCWVRRDRACSETWRWLFVNMRRCDAGLQAWVTLWGLGSHSYDLSLSVKSEGLIPNEDAQDGIGCACSREQTLELQMCLLSLRPWCTMSTLIMDGVTVPHKQEGGNTVLISVDGSVPCV